MAKAKLNEKVYDGLEQFIDDQLDDADVGGLHARVDEDWDVYRQRPPGYNSFEGCSNIRSDVVRNAVDAKVAHIAKTVLRSPDKYKVRPRFVHPDAEINEEQRAQILSKGWSYVFDVEAELNQELYLHMTDLVVQGFAIFRLERFRHFDARANGDGAMELGLRKDLARARHVFYRNFLCDEEYASIQDAPLVAEIKQYSGSQLAFMAEQAGWRKDVVEAVLDYERGRNTASLHASGTQSEAELPEPSDRPDENPLISLWEWFAEIPTEFTGYQYPLRMFGMYHEGLSRVLYANFLSLLDPENKYPFEVPTLYPPLDEGDRWWGYGVPTWNRVMSDLVDDSLNRARDDALIHGRPAVVTSDRDNILRNQRIVMAPWTRIRVERPDAISFLEPPRSAHSLNLEQLMQFQQRYERQTNVYASSLGDVGDLKSHQTTTSVTSVLKQGQVMHTLDGVRIIRGYEPILRRVALIRATILNERVRAGDQIKPDPIMKVLNMQEFGQFMVDAKIENISDETIWEFDLTGLETQQDLAMTIQVMQLVQANPLVASFPELMNDIMVDLLSMMDYPEAAKFKKDPKELVDRQTTIQAQSLLKAQAEDREKFIEGMSEQAVQKFIGMIRAAMQPQQGGPAGGRQARQQ